MRRISRAEAAAVRRDALRTWRYPWRETVIACVVLAGTGAWSGGGLATELGAARAPAVWAGAAAGLAVALALTALLRRRSISLLERSVGSGLVGVTELTLLEISCIDAYGDIRFEIDDGRPVTLRQFDSADAFSLLGLRTRGQWIADEVRAQAERRGNYAVQGADWRGRRDCWPRRAPWS